MALNKIHSLMIIATAAAVALLPRVAEAATCESLTSLKLPDTMITSAQTVNKGAFQAPGAARGANPYTDLPAFCRVEASVKPSADSDIKIEVWMPASGWNSKLEAVGNGGWSGSI